VLKHLTYLAIPSHLFSEQRMLERSRYLVISELATDGLAAQPRVQRYFRALRDALARAVAKHNRRRPKQEPVGAVCRTLSGTLRQGDNSSKRITICAAAAQSYLVCSRDCAHLACYNPALDGRHFLPWNDGRT